MQTSNDLIYNMAKFQEPLPLIVLPLTKDQFEALKNKLLGSDLDNDKKNKLMARMAHAETPTRSYTWQQDYFQSTVAGKSPVWRRRF